MIKRQINKIEYFLSIKKYLVDKKKSFEYISSGSINIIRTTEMEWKFINSKTNAGHGHHISRMVKRDINLWLKDNSIEPNKRDYKEQLFNLGNMQRVVGESVVMVDINDCYWTTAKNLGYITEDTFNSGLKKREWKLGRNAAIGSLAKISQVTSYKNGVLEKNKGGFIESPKDHQYVRNHIIGHVYKVFLDLANILGSDFFMFLTDCVVTTVYKRNLVEDYLLSKGYKSKYKTIEFTNIDSVSKKVNWFDYSSIRRDASGMATGKGKNKHYNYANHQLIEFNK